MHEATVSHTTTHSSVMPPSVETYTQDALINCLIIVLCSEIAARVKNYQAQDSDNPSLPHIGFPRLGSMLSSNALLERLRTCEVLCHTRPNGNSRLLVFLICEWKCSSASKRVMIMSDDECQKRTFLRKHEIVECTIVELVSRSIILLDVLLYGSLSDVDCSLEECVEASRQNG